MEAPLPLSPLFSPVTFADLPGWPEDDHLAAFEAFRRCAFHVPVKRYRTGSLGVAFESFADAYRDSRETAFDRRGAAYFTTG